MSTPLIEYFVDVELCDLPPDARGMTGREFREWQFQRMLSEQRRRQSGFSESDFNAAHPVQTSRDRYGWRGLRGTAWIGPQGKDVR